MTKDKALKLALEAFNDLAAWNDGEVGGHMDEPYASEVARRTITAIKEALAQPEPVAWGVFEGNLHDMFFTQSEAQEMAKLKGTHAEVRPLYAAPQRTWAGLTDEDFLEACQIAERGNYLVAFQRIQAKLKEKNA